MRSLYRSLVVLVFLAAVGCYSYYPYGYGGYPGPSTFPPGAPAPTNMVPQGAYLSPNDFSVGNGQRVMAGSENLGSQQQWRQYQDSNNTPMENFDPEASPDASTEQAVPDPRDPGEFKNPPQPGANLQNKNGSPSSPFGMNDGPQIQLEGIDDLNASLPDTEPRTGSEQPVALTVPSNGTLHRVRPVNEDPFMPPVTVTPISVTTALPEVVLAKNQLRPNPFDYDRKNYRWLRGIVDFDEQDQSWHLMYSEAPESDDQYGGDLTLMDHPQLAELRDSDIILVEGRIDQTMRDRLGKPGYRIDNLVGPLVPKK